MDDLAAPRENGGPAKKGNGINGGRHTDIRGGSSSEYTPLLAVEDTGRRDSWIDEEFEARPWWRRPSVYWLLGPYFLFTLAFGGILVPKLNLILDLVCREYFADEKVADPNFSFAPVILGADNPQCQIPPVQKIVAKFTLVMNLVIGLLSALIAPKLGHMSDRFGRKRWMGLSSCGGIVAEAITILAAKYPDTVDYRWILVGAVCDGLTGSFTAGSLLSHSYASDCTPPSKRGVAIGYLHACLFTGLALGPLIAAEFIKRTGSLISIFYVVLGCHIFFVLFLSFAIPESLSKRRQLVAREKHAKELQGQAHLPWLAALRHRNPFTPLKILYPTGAGTSFKLRRNLIAMAIVDTILLGGAFGAATVIILYGGYMFKWDTVDNSRFVSTVSMVRAFVLLGVFPVLNYFLRIRPARRRQAEGTAPPPVEKNEGCDEVDIWLVRSALISDVIGVTSYIFVRSPALFYVSGIITAFGGLGSATIQAALTKHVPNERVGQLLGAIGLLHALARVLAPMAFNSLYYLTIETFPQAIFVLLCSLFVIALVASFLVRPRVYFDELREGNEEGDSSEESTTPAPAEEELVI